MKRMNLIRATLFAVFAFMGTVSLSAQQSWVDPAVAIVVINNELAQMAAPTPPNMPSTPGVASKEVVLELNAKVGCPDCFLKSVKYRFLTMSLERIKSGEDTGPAVEAVRALFIQDSHSDPNFLATIQQAYLYMDTIL